MAHYQLALTSPSNKEFVAHTEQAVALAGKASEGERLAILGLQAGANSDPTKSLEYAKEAVQKYPGDERARQTLAFNYSGRQEYEKAVEELNKAIEINPEFSAAYNSLGYAYRPLNRNAEAEKAFKKYIELVPNDPNPYDSYAELLMKTGRFDESIAQYRKALSIDPHFTNSYYGIAGNLMYQGKYPQAIAEAEKLTECGAKRRRSPPGALYQVPGVRRPGENRPRSEGAGEGVRARLEDRGPGSDGSGRQRDRDHPGRCREAGPGAEAVPGGARPSAEIQVCPRRPSRMLNSPIITTWDGSRWPRTIPRPQSHTLSNT